MNIDILEHLKKTILKKSKDIEADKFIIRSLWNFTMQSNPNPNERIFMESAYIVATSGLGVSFSPRNQRGLIQDSLIGQDGREISTSDRALQIAILDACYSAIPHTPERQLIIEGDSTIKSHLRAQIVANEVKKIANRLSIKEPVVLVIGVVNTIIEEFNKSNITTILTDLDPLIIGSRIFNVEVNHGKKNCSLIPNCDIVLASGMTLATDGIDEILKATMMNKKPLVMFAQTGSNFAEEYLALGIDTVISEGYPWYVIPGQSVIRIYRRDAGGIQDSGKI